MRTKGNGAFAGRLGGRVRSGRWVWLRRGLTQLACAVLMVSGLTGLAGGLLPSASAATITCTWTGGGGTANWSTGGNWDCGSGTSNGPPGPGDILIFPLVSTSSGPSVLVDDMSGLSVSELEFQGPGYVINPGTGITLTLAPSSVGGVSILDSGTTLGGENQISVPLDVSVAQEFQVTGSDNLDITAPLAGSGSLATYASSLSGGVITLSGDNSVYSGAITAGAGFLNVDYATALGTVPVTVDAPATLIIQVASVTMTNTLNLSGSLTSGAAGDVWSGPITLSGANPDVGGPPDATFTLSGLVSGSVTQQLYLTGGTSVTSTGAQLPCSTSTVLDLADPADHFTGGSFVNCGTVEIHGPGALGSGSVQITQGTTLALVNGGTGYPVTNPVLLGTFIPGQTAGAVIEDLSGGDSWSGSVSVCPGPPDSGIQAATGTFQLSGRVTLSASPSACSSGSSTTAAPSSASITGAVELGGPVEFSLGGTSTGDWSQLVLGSGASLSLNGASLGVQFTGGFVSTTGDSFDLVSSGTAVTGTFAGLAQGATFPVGSREFEINYAAAPGTDVAIADVGPAAPIVTTGSAGSVTTTSATLNGTVNPNGSATTYQFEYGTTPGYGSFAPASPVSIGSGSSAQAESVSLTGLAPSTTYDFRLVATNANGTTDGSNETFTTLAGPTPPSGPIPPPPPSGSVSSASGTSDSPSGTATATNDGTTASGSGVGALTVAQYASDPVGAPAFSSSGMYFDVALSSPNSFTGLTITDCNLGGGASLYWWNPAALGGAGAWETVSNQSYSAGPPPCVTATINTSTSPDLAQLTGTVFAVADGTAYTPITPTRVCDTRAGNPSALSGAAAQCDGKTLHAGLPLEVTVAGLAGVPASGVSAVILNVTVTDPSSSGFLTVYPAGQAAPLTSNLNFTKGETVANSVEVGLGSAGQIAIVTNATTTDVVVDVEGYVASTALFGTGLYNALTPARICDTRTGTSNQCTGKTMGPDTTMTVHVAGLAGVPASAEAVALNVTVTDTTGSGGYLTVYPGGSRPMTSNLNWTAGQTVANLVVTALNSSGEVTIYNHSGSADVVVDVLGYYSGAGGTGSQFIPETTPTRICDTRVGSKPTNQCTGKTMSAGGTMTVQVSGLAGVPMGATAVAVNVTVTNTTAASYLTIFPSGTRPLTSNLNWEAGATVSNLVIATLSATGEITIYNHAGTTDVVLDVMGWYQ